MSLRIAALVLLAEDPARLAAFWAEALGWSVGAGDESDDGGVLVVPTDSTRFGLVVRPGASPKVGQNRIHLDLTTTSLEDQATSAERLVDLGGRHIDIGQRPEEGHVVLADPEGNELCLIGPGNRFLAGCERLGAVNCEGLRATGVFWHEALDWPLVWDQDEETAIRHPDLDGPLVTWSGPPVPPKAGPNRFRLELAADGAADAAAEVARLAALGATTAGEDAAGTILLDPDGNELVVRPTG